MKFQKKTMLISLVLTIITHAAPGTTTSSVNGEIVIENQSQCSVTLANGKKSLTHESESGLSYEINNSDETPHTTIQLSFNGVNTKNQYHIPLFFSCEHTTNSGTMIITGTNQRIEVSIEQKKETLNSAQMVILNENFIDDSNKKVDVILYQPEWKAFKTS